MRSLLFILTICVSSGGFAQDTTSSDINWLTWDEAMTAKSLEPRKVFVYVYEEGNKECAVMDSIFEKDTVIQWYLSNEYYPIKLDAQMKDTVKYKRRTLTYREYPDKKTGYHDLPAGIIKYNFTFPAVVVFDEDMKRLRIAHGYINPKVLDRMLGFYADDAHLMQNAVPFGPNVQYKCKNPNHPHNRLRMIQKEREDQDQKKEE